jgi:hypothetical protein
MPTSAGSEKIAPNRLCTGRSAALAFTPATMRAKTDSIILRDIVKPRLIREPYRSAVSKG